MSQKSSNNNASQAGAIANQLQTVMNMKEYPRYNLDRNHIFYAIHTKLMDTVPGEEHMHILYHFEEIKKVLALSRRNQINLSRLTLKFLESQELCYSNELAEIGMRAIHLPMLAYLSYVDSNFDEAEAQLKESINLMNQLIDRGINDCKVAILEQYLNIFKVQVVTNKIEAASDTAMNLFYAVVSMPSIFLHSSLDPTDLKDELGIVHNYINGILKVLLQPSKKDNAASLTAKKRIRKELLKRIQSSDLNYDHIPFLKEMLLFSTSDDRNSSDLYQLTDVGQLFNPEVPSFVQSLLLRDYFEGNNDAIVDDYFNDILNIPLNQSIYS